MGRVHYRCVEKAHEIVAICTPGWHKRCIFVHTLNKARHRSSLNIKITDNWIESSADKLKLLSKIIGAELGAVGSGIRTPNCQGILRVFSKEVSPVSKVSRYYLREVQILYYY